MKMFWILVGALSFIFLLSAVRAFAGQTTFDGAVMGVVAYLVVRDFLADK